MPWGGVELCQNAVAEVSILLIMLKLLPFAIIALLIACEKKEASNEKAVVERAVDSYGALIEKAKETEALLQKKADSITLEQDLLAIPR